jgi:hypothetical protein
MLVIFLDAADWETRLMGSADEAWPFNAHD